MRKHGLKLKNTSEKYCQIAILFLRHFCPVLVSINYSKQVSHNVLDKLASLILSKRRDSKDWEEYLLTQDQAIFQRLGWFLRAKYFARKTATDQEIEQTLTYIEEHLKTTDPLIQWTMNQCLVEIAVTYPDYLEKGRAIGQKLGVYSEMKVAKGCTSAYAPDWIESLFRKK